MPPAANRVGLDQPEVPAAGRNNFWYRLSPSDTVIVFVHGVLSDSRSCWLSEKDGKQVYWPSLAAEDKRLHDSAIYLGGYYTAIDAGPYEIRNAADEVFSALNRTDEHGNAPVMSKPNLVFVCHSTGGIVVRYMLTSKYEVFAKTRVGLVLIASPSYGSRLADRLGWLTWLYRHSVGRQLQWGHGTLRDLDAQFKNLVHERRIPHLCGIEAYENHFVIHRKWLPDKHVVVTEESAGRYFGAPVLLRNTDHFSAAKPDGMNHPSHELLVDFLQKHFTFPFPRRPEDLPDTADGTGQRTATERLSFPGSDAVFVSHLPIQPTPLVDRDAEVGTIKPLLLRDDIRLLTLTGPPGTGKTRVALQVAAELVEMFRDGAYFVDLAPLGSPAQVIPTVAHTLGVAEVVNIPIAKTLEESLRDKCMLLLLDNFEQVTAAAVQIANLLAACPQLKVLTTSRAPLHLREEHVYPIAPLALPAPPYRPPYERLSQYAAVELFIQHAVAVRPDFQISNENALAVVEICSRLDGLPLAIELVAARIRMLPPQALLRRLESRLRMATGGSVNLPTRQRTLREAIGWSYDLLDASGQLLFRRLAVFSGGCTLDAIEAVSNASGDLAVDVVDQVGTLVDYNLLRQPPLERESGNPRFAMLETVHEYAAQRLRDSGEEESIRQYHADYYLDLAEQAHTQLRSAEQEAWLERLERDHHNLRAALSWYERSTATAMRGVQLAGALWWFWYLRGYYSEGRAFLERALTAAGEVRAPARARALNGAGYLARHQGEQEQAAAQFQQALSLARQLDDRPNVAEGLSGLGLVAWDQGDNERAVSLLEDSLAIFRHVGEPGDIAIAVYCLGVAVQAQGALARAALLLEESLALSRSLGFSYGIALVLEPLGQLAYARGDTDGAAALFKESLALCAGIQYTRGIGWSLDGLGRVAHTRGDFARAAELLGAAAELRRKVGSLLPPAERPAYEHLLADLRTQLGAEQFMEVWQRGELRSTEEVITSALTTP